MWTKAKIIFALIVPFASIGATYYVDFAGGNDASAGTSTGAAWKLAPVMSGFGGSYSHSAGDRFIFKGGVTWSNSFPWTMNIGTSGARDYYGVDATWYAGGSWSKPVFDASEDDLASIGGTLVNCFQKPYNTFDSLVITNITWSANNGSDSHSGILFNSTAGITVTNCELRNFIPTGTGSDDFYAIYGMNSTGCRVTGCAVTGKPTSTGVGAGVAWCDVVDNNTFSDMPNGAFGKMYACSNNFVYNISTSVDAPTAHENALYQMIPGNAESWFCNNLLSNNAVGMLVYITLYAAGTTNATNYCFNNVVYGGGQPAITLDPEDAGNGTRGVAHIYNNTLVGTASGVRVQHRTGADWSSVSITNNHFIGGTVAVDVGSLATVTHGSNLTNTAAAAALDGYLEANSYAPTNAEAATVDVGLDLGAYFGTDRLGATRGATWDIGAYEYSGESPAPPSGGNGSARATNARIGTLIFR